MDEIQVNVNNVGIVGTKSQPMPVVFLSDGSNRFVPICIGITEAASISSALRNEISPRPMTHDLMVSMLDTFGAAINKILIDEIDDEVYYARLFIRVNESVKELDARPSDCLALALRTGSDIFIRETVFEKVAIDKNEMESLYKNAGEMR